ncbi:hypothetical protein JCM10213_000776 [Rhodosporidiobolus nylandii]
MNRLPAETLAHIFRLAVPSFTARDEPRRPFKDEDRKTLKTCTLVSRQWRHVATPLLYTNVELRFNEAQGLFLRTVEAKPELGKRVRSVGIDYFPMEAGMPGDKKRTENVRRIAIACPNVQSVRLNRHQNIEAKVLAQFTDLRELVLMGNLSFWDDDLPTFPRLVVLSLQPTVFNMKSGVSPLAWLCPTYLPSLRALALDHLPTRVQPFLPLQQFPNLRAFAGFGNRYSCSEVLTIPKDSLPPFSIIHVSARAIRSDPDCDGWVDPNQTYALDPCYLLHGTHVFLYRSDEFRGSEATSILEELKAAIKHLDTLPPGEVRLKGIFVSRENLYDQDGGRNVVRGLRSVCSPRGIEVTVVDSGKEHLPGDRPMFPDGFVEMALKET